MKIRVTFQRIIALIPIADDKRQTKEECSDPLTKSVSASVPSNSVTESVVDPVIMATRVDSLSLSIERDGFRSDLASSARSQNEERSKPLGSNNL